MNTAKLLNYLWQGGQFSYFWTAPEKRSYWFSVNKISPIPNGNRNVYFGVNPVARIPLTNARGEKRDRRYIRSQNGYIGAINTVFGEFDIKDFGSKEAIFDHLSDYPPASVTIFSGGGYHLYWLLDEPFIIGTEADREQARRVQANWVDYTGSDKQSKDLARVLRVPGTKNYKPQYAPDFPTVTIIDHIDKRYTLRYLEKLSEPPPQPKPDPLPHPMTLPTADDRQWYANHAFRITSDMLRDAPDGEKHGTLLKAARLLGGYCAGGIINEAEAVNLLENEIAHKPNVDDLNQAYKTIRDGIEYGKAEPITLNQKLAERQLWRQQQIYQARKEYFFNAQVLDSPDWMTVLTWGEIATTALDKAGFETIGIKEWTDDLVQHLKNCHQIFIAAGPKKKREAKEVYRCLCENGLDAKLCSLPCDPDDFFYRYGGTAKEMFTFLKFGY